MGATPPFAGKERSDNPQYDKRACDAWFVTHVIDTGPSMPGRSAIWCAQDWRITSCGVNTTVRDGIDLQIGDMTVDHDDWNLRFDQLLAGMIDLARGRNHDPGHALGQHQIDIQLLLLNIFVEVAEKHGILMLISDIFDSTCEDIEKGF